MLPSFLKFQNHTDEIVIETGSARLSYCLILAGVAVLGCVMGPALLGQTDLSTFQLAVFGLGAILICGGISHSSNRQTLLVNSSDQTLLINSSQIKEYLHADEIQSVTVNTLPEVAAHQLTLETTDGRTIELAVGYGDTRLKNIAASINKNLGLAAD